MRNSGFRHFTPGFFPGCGVFATPVYPGPEEIPCRGSCPTGGPMHFISKCGYILLIAKCGTSLTKAPCPTKGGQGEIFFQRRSRAGVERRPQTAGVFDWSSCGLVAVSPTHIGERFLGASVGRAVEVAAQGAPRVEAALKARGDVVRRVGQVASAR